MLVLVELGKGGARWQADVRVVYLVEKVRDLHGSYDEGEARGMQLDVWNCPE